MNKFSLTMRKVTMKILPLIKTLIFYALLSLRRIILSISKLFSLLFLGCFGIMFLFNNLHMIPLTGKIMMLILGIIFTLIYWLYDYLILIFKPENIMLRLHK